MNNDVSLGSVTHELMCQAFLLYESNMSSSLESKKKTAAVSSMIGTLLSCRVGLERDDYESLITKTTQFAAKLVKKTDQCRGVILCSHLFFTGDIDVSGQPIFCCLDLIKLLVYPFQN